MERKFFIVANPVSGRKKANKVLGKLEERLATHGLPYHIFLTPHVVDLSKRIANAISVDTTDVVVIGGDGTLNATAQAIYKKDIVLNILPSGTGNDFVKTLNLGKNLNEWIDTILLGKEKLIDAGICNDRIFLNGVGLGFDGQIVHDHLFTNSILTGHAKYYSHVVRILGTYRARKVQFKLDGGIQRTENLLLMAVHNGTTFGGGFKLNPDAKIDDGLLNICTIGPMAPLKRFLNIGRLSLGTHGVLDAVNFYQTKSIEIAGDRSIHAHIDGEYLGNPPYKIQLLKSAIKVRVKNNL